MIARKINAADNTRRKTEGQRLRRARKRANAATVSSTTFVEEVSNYISFLKNIKSLEWFQVNDSLHTLIVVYYAAAPRGCSSSRHCCAGLLSVTWPLVLTSPLMLKFWISRRCNNVVAAADIVALACCLLYIMIVLAFILFYYLVFHFYCLLYYFIIFILLMVWIVSRNQR